MSARCLEFCRPLPPSPARRPSDSLVQAQTNEWSFANLRQGELWGQLLGWLSMMVIYLFIWYLVRTSSERGRSVTELQNAANATGTGAGKELELAALHETRAAGPRPT